MSLDYFDDEFLEGIPSIAPDLMFVEKKKLEFAYADFGAIGLETCYSLINTYTDLSQEKIVEVLTLNASQIFKLDSAIIEEQQIANLCFFNPEKEWILRKEALASKSSNTPLDGQHLKGIILGIVNNRRSHIFGDR